MRPGLRVPCLVLAFTLSGAAALLAEQVFEKLLSTLVGASTPAGAIVLAVYFAGLTTGSLLYPALRRFGARRVVSYPALELLVAATCLALTWRFDALVPVFAPLLRLGVGRPPLLTLMRGLVASAWILPLTVPMGATFPAIIDAADRVAPVSRARAVSALYAGNLVGAVLAAASGPIVIFPVAGMTGGLWAAAAFDVVAALLALLVVSSARGDASARPPDTPRIDAHPRNAAGRPSPSHLLAFAFATGFLLFGLEVTWTHLACVVIGSSVYAFASMLTSVLVGLGLGSLASAWLFGRSSRVPAWTPGLALALGALTLAVTHAGWPHAPRALGWLGSRVTSFGGHEAARFAILVAVVVPPAAILGAAYPLLFRVPAFPETERGRAAGRVAAVNALGCIAGSLIVGFGLLPGLGSEMTELALAALAAATGGALVVTSGDARARVVGLSLAGLTLAAVFVVPSWNRLELTSGEHVYFRSQYEAGDAELISFHEDSLGGITSVIATRSRGDVTHTLLTNGKFQGNDAGEMVAQTSFALAPMQFLKGFDRALVVGLGTGRTASVVAEMGFGTVDIAEISPGIVGAARATFAHVNDHVLDRPNVSLFLEDGRNLLLLRDTKYDLVTVELNSVWFAGATNLYSSEFYSLVRDRLREGGVLQQWIQLHHIGLPEIASVLSTVHEVFPYVSLFVLGGQGLVVASMSAEEVQPAFVDRVRGGPSARLLGVEDDSAALALLASSRLLAPADVDLLARFPDVRLNTDANRFLEYATPRYNHRTDDLLRANVSALASLAAFPDTAVAAGVDDRARSAILHENPAVYFGISPRPR